MVGGICSTYKYSLSFIFKKKGLALPFLKATAGGPKSLTLKHNSVLQGLEVFTVVHLCMIFGLDLHDFLSCTSFLHDLDELLQHNFPLFM